MRALFFPLLIACWFLCTTCGSKDCPGFPDHLSDYFPYQKGQKLLFTNERLDTLSLLINTLYKAKEYTVDNYGKCACDGPAYAFSTEKDNRYSLYIPDAGIALHSRNTVEIICKFSQYDNFHYDLFNKEVDISAGTAVFGDTVLIENPDGNRISMLMIVKGLGIVEFEDKEHTCIWKKASK